MAGIKSEFDRRNVKILGLSVDPVDDHNRWVDDIRDVTGYAPNYPLIGDPELKIAKLYGMLPARRRRHVARAARPPTTPRCATSSSSRRTRPSS